MGHRPQAQFTQSNKRRLHVLKVHAMIHSDKKTSPIVPLQFKVIDIIIKILYLQNQNGSYYKKGISQTFYIIDSHRV